MGALAVGYVIGRYLQLLLVLFAGVLLGVLLRGFRDAVADRTGLRPTVALLLVLAVIAGVITGIGWIVGPAIANQTADLRERLPEALAELRGRIESYEWGRRLIAQAPTSVEKVVESQGGVVQGATNIFSQTLSIVAGIFVVVFSGIFLAAEPRSYLGGLVRFVPPRRRERAREVLTDVELTLRWWLIARAIGMTFVGLCIFVGLLILGHPLALVFGLIAGLFDFIPYFGPLIAAVPAVLLALVNSPTQALYVAALYAGVQAVQNFLVEPLLERKTVRLLPALILGFQVVLGSMAGIVGAALASPLLAVITVLVNRLYVQDVLGDRDEARSDRELAPEPPSHATTSQPAATR